MDLSPGKVCVFQLKKDSWHFVLSTNFIEFDYCFLSSNICFGLHCASYNWQAVLYSFLVAGNDLKRNSMNSVNLFAFLFGLESAFVS